MLRLLVKSILWEECQRKRVWLILSSPRLPSFLRISTYKIVPRPTTKMRTNEKIPRCKIETQPKIPLFQQYYSTIAIWSSWNHGCLQHLHLFLFYHLNWVGESDRWSAEKASWVPNEWWMVLLLWLGRIASQSNAEIIEIQLENQSDCSGMTI